ncbi:MAG TPA: isoleucine--tRNA ligase [Longimicrobiales bacterium]|nr:isoleucine--tRNA ligase [Longimicrobiales bacterium]
MRYPEFPDSYTALEEEVLARWHEEDLFRRTLDATAAGEPFVFYEGPPTANGRPGIHHVFSRTLKDLVCRYRTMRGRYVGRKAGWDTHGLPVEIEAEKKLGISGKRQIEELGVERFNQVCRESVFTYKEDWEKLSERIGYWLDYSDPYVTFHDDYIETVWWLLKQLDDRGLIYRGYRSVPYCPRCGTALSSHEVAQGYAEVEDPSVHFLCRLEDGEQAGEGERAFVAWTTTPWTIPSNAALAVNPALTYAEVEHEGRGLIVAEALVERVFGEDARVRRTWPAAELIGLRYRRPLDLVDVDADQAAAGWKVVGEDFVSADDGTGIVHIAPAFGSDDYAAGQRHGLPMLRPIDDDGRFVEEVPVVGGMFVKEADPLLLDEMRARGVLLRSGTVTHSYPHCWRCDSPLLYMARDSWYIRTTAVKDRMLENNRQVRWSPPEIGSGRFGEWLEGNVDWALSRDRYWGTPLPAWICDRDRDHVDFIGSFAELAERAGGLPEALDPHKPFIDEIAWPCRQCGGTMHRTPEVIDAWFDSGSMPFAQWHYPFANQDTWARNFPADFIAEGVDQTRGWFYSLMAIATMLGHGPVYRNVLVNGLLLDRDGQKMSKSRGNVVDPWEAIGRFGADAVRWYLVTVSQPWAAKRWDEEALGEAVRRTFDTLANTYRFFALYANLEEWTPAATPAPPADRPLTDRWLRSRMAGLVAEVGTAFDRYDVTRGARLIGDFIVDDLSNWYVRRGRDRFWGAADAADTRHAFTTLWEALVTVSRLLAPVTPFLADWVHRGVTGESVHLAPFPAPEPGLRDEGLEREMEAVRALSSLGRAARDQVRIRVRQPLRTLHALTPGGPIRPALLDVLKDELNVKDVRFLGAAEEVVTLEGKPNFRTLGQRFGGRTQEAAAAVRALSSDTLSRFRAGAVVVIEVDGESHELGTEDLEVVQNARGELVVESAEGYTVALDPALDEALRLEGLARELVNRVQRLRKDSGLEVSDRIRLRIGAADELRAAAERHREYIAGETLATSLDVGPLESADGDGARELDVDGMIARVALSVANR